MPDRPSLLDELGLDESSLHWRQLVRCKNMDLANFYEKYEENTTLAIQMDEVCLGCPVLKECLLEATSPEFKDTGLRGGIYLSNGKTDKQRNAHKTDEVWLRIQKRLK